MRNHGSGTKYFHDFVGGNFRLDPLQAAILQVKLPHLDSWSAARQRNADRYRTLFAESGRSVAHAAQLVTSAQLVPALQAEQRRHVYNQFVIRVRDRDALREHLTRRGIGHEVYYPLPFHLQQCFTALGHHAGDFPHSELAAKESLALPIYPELSASQLEEVAGAVLEFLAERG